MVQHDEKNVEGVNTEVMFTQEEVNDMMRKRLKRVKRKFDYDFENKILQIEVMEKLVEEKIPTHFATFIMISKNHRRTRKTLEQFIKTWQETVKK